MPASVTVCSPFCDFIRYRLTTLVAVFWGLATSATAWNDADAVVWDRVIPELESIRKLEARRDSLPQWHLFRTTRKENREKIQKILDETVMILGISPIRDLRLEIGNLATENRADENKIALLMEKRVGATNDSIFGQTVEGINREIASLKQDIAERNGLIAAKKDEFTGNVAAIGLTLSHDQVDFLLATVVGDSVIDIGVAFYNVKRITSQLETLADESQESIEIARRYYGMYTVLLQALDEVYRSALLDIDERYLVEIDMITSRTRSLVKETKALLRVSNEQHRAALNSNIRTQEVALDTAQIYREYLKLQRAGIDQAQAKLQKTIAVANNTYETVKISGDLLRVMRASENLFALLFELQVPELRPFRNLEMKREFEKLTTQLRGD